MHFSPEKLYLLEDEKKKHGQIMKKIAAAETLPGKINAVEWVDLSASKQLRGNK